MDEPKNRRLFIGIPVDPVCQQRLDVCLQPLQQQLQHSLQQQYQEIHWAPHHNRHLTLFFLGNTTTTLLTRLQQLFAAAYPGNAPFSLPLTELARFPDPHGHVVAALSPVTEPLEQLHQQTVALMRQCGIVAEKRTFRPHITLGKIRNPKQVKGDFHQNIELQLKVDRVAIYESLATPAGRLYQVMNEKVFQP